MKFHGGRFVVAIALVAAFSGWLSIAQRNPPRQRNRKVLLAWADTRNGIAQHDSVSHALAVIERLGYESGAYDTYIRTDSTTISKHPLMTDGKPASGGPSPGRRHWNFFLRRRGNQPDAQQEADPLPR